MQGEVAKTQDEATNKAVEGYRVGSDLNVKASFKDGLFLWFETPHKDFAMHLGALDAMGQRVVEPVAGAEGQSGCQARQCAGRGYGGGHGRDRRSRGRRILPSHPALCRGRFLGDRRVQAYSGLENNQFSTSGLDEFWVGETHIPVIGSCRVGHVKDPMGLEGDMTASSRCMTFMERSSYSEAIELNQNFVTGIWFSDNYFDQRMTWEAAFFRPDQAASRAPFSATGSPGCNSA